MTDIERFGYKDLTDEVLDKRLADKKSEVSKDSKKTIADRFNLGKLLTDKQMNEIRSKVQAGSIKSIKVKVPVYDKKTHELTGFEEQVRFYNKHVVRIDAAIVAGTLDDESVVNANKLTADATAHMNSVMFDVHNGKAEIAALNATKASRESVKLAKLIEDKKMTILNLGQIYERAVSQNKLTEVDQKAAIEEGDDVPKHSATTATRTTTEITA